MNTLSLCVICKNEENNIKNLLESVKGDIFDEIVITDTGSTDKTVENAREYTPHIYFFEWINDFAAARNFCFSKATSDYIMWLDSDDVLLPEDYTKLKTLKARLHENDMWLCKYEYAHDDQGNSICSFYRERIIRRNLNIQWLEPIHEYLPLTGSMEKTDIEIHHYKKHNTSDRNIPMLEDIVAKQPDNPRNMYYLGKEYYDAGKTDLGYATLKKFTKMPCGWSENRYAAFLKLATIDQHSKKYQNAKEFCHNALSTCPMRIEAYCKLGEIAFNEENWTEGIHWYRIASMMPRDPNILDLIEHKYYTWLPHLQLCVAYNSIGNLEKAALHNELALRSAPKDNRMINNKNIFLSSLKDKYPILEEKTLAVLFDKDVHVPKETSHNCKCKGKCQTPLEKISKPEAPKEDKKISIGWCVPNNTLAGTIRIRTLNIQKKLEEMGYVSKLCDYNTANEYDYIVVGKNYDQSNYNSILHLKEKGKKIICDLSEDILEYPFVKEIIRLSHKVICCSNALVNKVKEINENAILIEDAVEHLTS